MPYLGLLAAPNGTYSQRLPFFHVVIMVVRVATTFTNGTILPATKEPFFLGDAGIDSYISLMDQCDIHVEMVNISLEGLLRSSRIKLRATHRGGRFGKHSQVYRMVCRCADSCTNSTKGTDLMNKKNSLPIMLTQNPAAPVNRGQTNRRLCRESRATAAPPKVLFPLRSTELLGE